jgi:hypothetical protein
VRACGYTPPTKRKPATKRAATKRKPALKRKRKPAPPPRPPVVKRHVFAADTSTCSLCGLHRRLVVDEDGRELYLHSNVRGADAIWSTFRPGCVVVG